ncbi:MAG: zinc-binding dehydrogenase [Lentisphaeria bacterium]|jgi:2-desacetyl-2-hydroxyethyl bacteriochlorophyllide A dehydrogenase
MKSKVIIFTAPYKVAIDEIEMPPLKKGQVLTKTLYTGVSTGTETRVLVGRQTGTTFPCIPGYENVGEVVDVGEGVALKKGAKVFVGQSEFTGPFSAMWGGQVEYAISNAERLISIPDNTDLVSALYAKTCAIALHGMKRVKVTSNDKVAIVGQGLIGHLAAQIAKARGALVIAIDTIDERLEASKQAGVDHVINASRENVKEMVNKFTHNELSVAVDVTGLASTIESTIQLLPDIHPWKPPFPAISRFLLLGSYVEPITINYSFLFEIEPDVIISRDCNYTDLIEALALISSGQVKPRGIPTTMVPFADAPKAYDDLINRRAMRVVYKW